MSNTTQNAEKNAGKDGKAFYKLMNNEQYLRKRIDVALVSNKKDYLKCTWKSNDISQKIFNCDLKLH